MDVKRAWSALSVAIVVVLVAFLLVQFGYLPAPWGEDRADVRVVGDDGTTKAVVDADVADTWGERHTGLSEHDSLAAGEGMLFVHSSEGDRRYVMREMDFDIDILFIGADGEITTIHHARAPGPGEDGEDLEYTGRGKWVLEVPRGYVNETGIEVGDEVRISYE